MGRDPVKGDVLPWARPLKALATALGVPVGQSATVQSQTKQKGTAHKKSHRSTSRSQACMPVAELLLAAGMIGAVSGSCQSVPSSEVV